MTRSAVLLLVPAFIVSTARAEPPVDPKILAASKRERLTLKDVKIEGGALIVSGSTGLPSRRVTILNAPEPRIAVTSDRKGDFTIRRTDFRPDDCRLTIGVVSGTQTALIANCGPRGSAGVAGPAGPKGDPGPSGSQGIQGPAGVQGIAGPEGTKGDTGFAGPAGPSGLVATASVVNRDVKIVEAEGTALLCEISIDLPGEQSGLYKVFVTADVGTQPRAGKFVSPKGSVILSRGQSLEFPFTELERLTVQNYNDEPEYMTPVGLNHLDVVTGPGTFRYRLEGSTERGSFNFGGQDVGCMLTALAVRS
jgi:hypothetical protein